MDLMFVILLVRCSRLFLFELLLEFIEGFQLAMRPTSNVMFAALLFQSSDADSELTSGSIDGEGKAAGKFFVRKNATPGRFGGSIGPLIRS